MADREPLRQGERLGDVRPDPRLSPDHAGHDRWLVVQWATDPADLTSTEVAQVRALVAACPPCASLAADLGIIGQATATSVVPSRPRDFRLTPERAAKARGGIGDRMRRWLGSPGAFVVRPLAGAALAIGLILVVVTPSLRPTVSTTGDDGAGRDARGVVAADASAAADATQVAGEAPVTEPTPVAEPTLVADTTQVAGETPVAEPTPVGGVTTGGHPEMAAAPAASQGSAAESDVTMFRMASPSPAAEAGTASAQDAERPAPSDDRASAERDGGAAETSDTRPGGTDDVTYVLTLLGIVLAAAGVMVLLLSWFARRWQDPLLR